MEVACRFATEAGDGLEIAAKDQPAMVIVDVSLGNDDGWELVSNLKANPATRNIPVVFVSLILDSQENLEIGASAYAPKQITLAQLPRLVEEVVKPYSRRVLIVGNDQDFSAVLVRNLEKLGIASDVCRDDERTLRKSRENRYGLIILDYYLDNVLGLEVLNRLKHELKSKIPVLLISGVTIDSEIEQEAITLGSRQFLNKKIGIKEMALVIKNHLKGVGENADQDCNSR